MTVAAKTSEAAMFLKAASWSRLLKSMGCKKVQSSQPDLSGHLDDEVDAGHAESHDSSFRQTHPPVIIMLPSLRLLHLLKISQEHSSKIARGTTDPCYLFCDWSYYLIECKFGHQDSITSNFGHQMALLASENWPPVSADCISCLHGPIKRLTNTNCTFILKCFY